MTTEHTAFDYDEITEALLATQSPFLAAETHGLLCGIICVVPENTQTHWEKIALGPEQNEHSAAILEQLYITSSQQIGEFSFEFALVLPHDNININLRTEALGLWCQGFLTGLQQNKSLVENNKNPEVINALNDLTEIAQVSFGDIPETSDDETAYFELVEYVRLTALMIYHELKSNDFDTLATDNDLLH